MDQKAHDLLLDLLVKTGVLERTVVTSRPLSSCERCGSDRPHGVTLFNVYPVELCIQCRREWNQIIHGHPTWQQAIMLQARRDHWSHTNGIAGESDWWQLRHDELANEALAREFAVQWVAEGKAEKSETSDTGDVK